MRDQWKHDLEAIFYRHGVDVVFEAHQHSYERTWPVYNGTVFNESSSDNGNDRSGSPYVNPRAPVHLVSGAAGNREGLVCGARCVSLHFVMLCVGWWWTVVCVVSFKVHRSAKAYLYSVSSV